MDFIQTPPVVSVDFWITLSKIQGSFCVCLEGVQCLQLLPVPRLRGLPAPGGAVLPAREEHSA